MGTIQHSVQSRWSEGDLKLGSESESDLKDHLISNYHLMQSLAEADRDAVHTGDKKTQKWLFMQSVIKIYFKVASHTKK